MSKTKKTPAGLARLVGWTLAIAITVPAIAFGAWDGQSWVYTSETHTTIAPATDWTTIAGLDAKARGLGGTAGNTTVDKWYWTSDVSNECPVNFDPPGGMIIIR